jgi:hypothetical protein
MEEAGKKLLRVIRIFSLEPSPSLWALKLWVYKLLIIRAKEVNFFLGFLHIVSTTSVV